MLNIVLSMKVNVYEKMQSMWFNKKRKINFILITIRGTDCITIVKYVIRKRLRFIENQIPKK